MRDLAWLCVFFISFGILAIMAEYGQMDKYSEGRKDCQMYQLLNHKNCPL